MKILCVANERRAAELAVNALRDLAHDVTVVWAGTLGVALDWVERNRDLGAAIVEAEVRGQGCPPLVTRIRDLGLSAPVIVVTPEHDGPPLAALRAGADDYAPNRPSLPAELPEIVRRGLQRARMFEARVRTTLEQERAHRRTLQAELSAAESARYAAERQLQAEMSEAPARIADLQTRLEAALADAGAGRIAFDQQVAVQRAEFSASLAEVTMTCDALGAELQEAAAALDRERQQRAADSAAAAAALDRFRRREAELGTALDESVALRHALEYRVSVVETARQQTERQAIAETRGAAERQADLESRLAQETTLRRMVEQTLADLESARHDAERRHAAEIAAAATTLADREARFVAEAAAAASVREALERRLAESQAALGESTERRQSEAAAAADELARRRSEFAAAIGEVSRSRDGLAQQLREALTTLEDVRRLGAAEAAAAAERLQRRETELGTMLVEATDARMALERQLAEAETARQRVEERAASEHTAATQRQTELEAQLASASRAFSTLKEKLAQTESAHRDAQERLASEMRTASAEYARRQADYEARLANAGAAETALHEQLRDAAAALERANQDRASDATAASAHLARREAVLGAAIAESDRTRAALEQEVAAARAAGQLAEERAAAEQAARERVIAALQEDIRQLRFERESLQKALDTEREQLRQLNNALIQERERRADDQQSAEGERLRLLTERAELTRALEHVRTEFHAVARVSSEHAAEAARLGTLATERDAQLRDQAARHAASQQAAKHALADVENRLRIAVDERSRDVAKLQADLDRLRGELDVARRDRDTLQTRADRVPHLLNELDQSRAEIHAHQEQTPLGMCRVTPEGVATHINRALVRLLGYRNAEELRVVDFGRTVFESEDDLRWLIERCLSTGTKETVETTWKRKNGARRIIRLVAFAPTPGAVELLAEDITDLRAMEEKLRQAQRMEAVGRLASEVAVTCNNLLRDVTDDGRRWLAALGSDTGALQNGEVLFSEITRAASFLRQLAVYGEQQTTAMEPVNVTGVLRGLEPVLRRVAGDEIEFVLPRNSRSLNVDVGLERVERILVNVAGYARQRMPSGGRLRFDVARVLVDRRFLAKYPNVRPGAHALITITEENRKKPSYWPAGHPKEFGEADHARSGSERPGMDLGVLLELIGDCGGHLWMAAEPSGTMVLKIHLPQPVSDAVAEPQRAVTRSVGERAMARLFRN